MPFITTHSTYHIIVQFLCPYRRQIDIINYWLRVECEIFETPPTNTTFDLAVEIANYLQVHFVGVSGIVVNSTYVISGEAISTQYPSINHVTTAFMTTANGFCDYENRHIIDIR